MINWKKKRKKNKKERVVDYLVNNIVDKTFQNFPGFRWIQLRKEYSLHKKRRYSTEQCQWFKNKCYPDSLEFPIQPNIVPYPTKHTKTQHSWIQHDINKFKSLNF